MSRDADTQIKTEGFIEGLNDIPDFYELLLRL